MLDFKFSILNLTFIKIQRIHLRNVTVPNFTEIGRTVAEKSHVNGFNASAVRYLEIFRFEIFNGDRASQVSLP